jgi:FAD-linked sulfhydryl oxidase
MLKQYPIKNGSRAEAVGYLCFLHNKVNERLNKPIFDCKKAFDYWGGNCGCSIDDE